MRWISMSLVSICLIVGAVDDLEACGLVQSTQSISFTEVATGPNVPVTFTLLAQGWVSNSIFCSPVGVGLTAVAWGASAFGSVFDVALRERTPAGVAYNPALHYLVQPDIITQLSPTLYERHRSYFLVNQVAPGLRTEVDIDLLSTGGYCAVYSCTSKSGLLTPTSATLTYTVIVDNAVYAVLTHTLSAAERATLASVYLR